MKNHRKYLMEDDQEAVRLDRKTDGATVEKQALWAGIEPGMRVADLGCGAGKTTFHLNKLVQPGGRACGIDVAVNALNMPANTIAMRISNTWSLTFASLWIISGNLILSMFDLSSNTISTAASIL